MSLTRLSQQFRAADRPPDLYLRPCGMLVGRAAEAAVESGVAQQLGGSNAFTTLEILWRDGTPRELGRASIPVAGFETWLERDCPAPARDRLAKAYARLIAPRADWAGFPLDRPRVMGIVNVTPDSFSDGGDHADAEAAIAHGRALMAAGADLLDIGGESTRPGAQPIAPETEIIRVLPVIKALAAAGAVVSVDTRHTAVMAAALDAGARIINDVSALRDPGALELVAVRRVPVVLMHLLGQPQDMQDEPRYACAPLDVWDFLDRRIDALEAAGGARSLALTDPGIGFGKTTAHNLGILDALGLYRSLGPGVLLGVSRKRLIEHCAGIATPPKQRLGGSLALALNGIAQGVDVVRVHDVAETVQAIRMWRAVCGEE